MTPSLFEYLPMYAGQLMKLAVAPKPAPKPQPPHKGPEVDKRLLLKKFKEVGVPGGEVLGKILDQSKTAAKKKELKKKPESPTGRMLKLIGVGAGGMALGTAAGYGTSRGVEALARRMGKPIPASGVMRYGIPMAGAGLGTAYSLWKAHEAEQLRRAIQSSRDQGK